MSPPQSLPALAGDATVVLTSSKYSFHQQKTSPAKVHSSPNALQTVFVVKVLPYPEAQDGLAELL